MAIHKRTGVTSAAPPAGKTPIAAIVRPTPPSGRSTCARWPRRYDDRGYDDPYDQDEMDYDEREGITRPATVVDVASLASCGATNASQAMHAARSWGGPRQTIRRPDQGGVSTRESREIERVADATHTTARPQDSASRRPVTIRSLLLVDCGSVFTTAALIGMVDEQPRLLAQTQRPTTSAAPIADVMVGARGRYRRDRAHHRARLAPRWASHLPRAGGWNRR